jgi:hypothetical protein
MHHRSSQETNIFVRTVLLRRNGQLSYFESTYDGNVCCGEVLRNVCVNLNVDPDQEHGYIKNVRFYTIDEKTFNCIEMSSSNFKSLLPVSLIWEVKPSSSLRAVIKGLGLYLLVEEIHNI